MHYRRRPRVLALGAFSVATLAATTALAAPAGTSKGPNTPTDPYVLPVGDGVHTKSLLTVSDAGAAGDGYELVGIPDGLGAYKDDEDSRDFTLLMNHELRVDTGAVRRHGQNGAFVSEWDIDSDTHAVEEGSDLVDPDIRYWDYPSQTYRSTPSSGGTNPRDPSDTFLVQLADFGRFCSSSLTDPGQLFNEKTGRGYRNQIYFANEENGDDARLFGVTKSGQAQQLPRLGLFNWENTLAAANETDTTLVVGQEDAAGGQIWLYEGHKQKTGNAFDKAGLTNGTNYVVDLDNEAVDSDAEFRAEYGKNEPAKFDFGPDEVVDWDSSGARQNADATANGLTLNRIEDGAFDPRNPNDFYFVTTEGSPGTVPSEPSVTRDGGGVWLLRFKNIERPERGGTLTLLLDGTEAPYLNKPDNVDMDGRGNFLIQEDPGNNAQLARIIAYNVDTGDRGVLAEFDPARFRAGGASFMTQDEESSGIIDAREFLGPNWFLFDAQVHLANPEADKVEYGQLLAMHVRRFKDVYTIDG